MDTVANSMDEIMLQLEKVDGVYFTMNKDSSWKFTTLCMTEGETFHEYETGTKYKIMLHENDDKILMFEAILGSPVDYVKNLIKTNQEGMILKKCNRAEIIFDQFAKIFKHEYVK